MIVARSLVRRSAGLLHQSRHQPPLSIPTQLRQLHLESTEAQDFLSSRLPSAKIGSSGSRNGNSKNNNSFSVLLHADRRPQRLSNDANERPFFGPSLLVCRTDLLPNGTAAAEKGLLGRGDLGLLKAQRDTPDQVVHAPIRYEQGFTEEHARQVVEALDTSQAAISSSVKEKATAVLTQLWTVFKETEGIWFTGQLVFEEDGSIVLESPFLEFDDFAVHRIDALKEVHQRWQSQRDSNTAQAEDGGLFYIKLHNGGKVGSFGYGAGNAMATMDGLAMAGAVPANFLDGGGGANVANAKLAIETLNRDPDVKSIFVNTFGGLTRCSLVAEGIIQAIRENDIKKPMTVRVMGTEAEEANELLRASGLPFTIEEDFKKAAKLAVEQAR